MPSSYTGVMTPSVATIRQAVIPVYRLETTTALSYNCLANEMKDALEALNMVSRVEVEKSVDHNGNAWMVTFMGFTPGSTDGIPPLYINGVNIAAAISPTSTVYSVNQYTVGNLTSGTAYYFNVAAINKYGVGQSTISTPSSIKPVNQVPSTPSNVRIFVEADNTINVQFDSPSTDGGQPVSFYRIQYDISSTFSSGIAGAPLGEVTILSKDSSPRGDVQVVTVVSEIGFQPAGTFVLSYLGQQTGELDYNISAIGMKKALESLSAVKSVSVSRELFCSKQVGMNNCGLDRG